MTSGNDFLSFDDNSQLANSPSRIKSIEAIFAFDSGNKITNEFLFRVLPLISSQANSKGAIKGSTLNSESIGQMQVPIPPIDEQKLIVEKVDELMAFCDQLESELTSRSEVAEKFARSVVNAA